MNRKQTSLSPANQIKLAEQMNDLARYFDSQFIIATLLSLCSGHASCEDLQSRCQDFANGGMV
jgi:predicted ATPase